MTEYGRFNAWLERQVAADANACWNWTRLDAYGYPKVYVGKRDGRTSRKQCFGHRLAYERIVGPVPDGLFLDHLCRVRSCCNPKHLEAVTMQVNVLRGIGPSAQNARKTHCKRGHPLTQDNLRKVAVRQRICAECMRMHARALYWKNPEKSRARMRGEKHNAASRAYYEANKERVLARQREHYRLHGKKRKSKHQESSDLNVV